MIERDDESVGCFPIIGLFFIFLAMTNTYFGWWDRINCHHEAHSMGFKSDYEFHWIGNNTCTYVLPNNKRILSSKYREME